jgi:transcriptional regulator with XRE-family HTH domain
MPAINVNLKLLRQAKGMTQADVAGVISVTRQTVSSYESGRTQPDLETLTRLADVYQVDLRDVLYGGNRLQGQFKRIQLAVIVLVAILLFGTLARSILYWTADKFYPLTAVTITARSASFTEMRFTLHNIAEQVSGICSTVYWVGCIAMIYPSITVANAISFRKLYLYLVLTISAIFACAIPFSASGTVNSPADSILSIFTGVIYTLLFFAAIVLTKLIKRRRKRR